MSGATVVVTDFHPEAARAGHGRSFRDSAGERRVIEHYVYEIADHERAAARAGLRLNEAMEPVVGPEIRSFYEDAGALDAYEAQRGLPLVAALQFVR
jgi:malonyl-CoA O-methyltransferase